MKLMKLLLEGKQPINEGLIYHCKTNTPLYESIYRYGSKNYFSMFKEARNLWKRGRLVVENETDKWFLSETNLGDIAIYEGKEVWLDFPYLNEAKPSIIGNMNAYGAAQVLGKGKKVLGYIQDTPNAVATLIQDYPQAQEIKFKSSFIFGGDTYKTIKKTDKVWKELQKRYIDNSTKEALKKGFSINEAQYDGKDVELGKPKKGGTKKYYVYVKDGDKVKKVQWGDTTGLKVKINNLDASKSFAARHKCDQEKDKTSANYWACNLPRYAKQLGLSEPAYRYW